MNDCKYICTQHLGAPKYIKQTLTKLKRDTHNSTIIGGDFNTPLSKWVAH